MARTAKHFLSNYKFPVMMMVSLPNGTILHKINANEFMEDDAPLSSIIEYA